MDKKILIVDDEKNIVDIIAFNLKKEGYKILRAGDGAEGVRLTMEENPDLILLDIMMPKMDGYEACKKIREKKNTPIIMLTARAEELDKVLGLELGADDYVTKPFKLGELCSRIRALLRRVGKSSQNNLTVIECGDIWIDLLGSRVLLNEKTLDLTSAEYRLICLLVRNSNRVITRNQILNELWDNTGDFVDDNTLSVYVRRLREKIEADPSHPEHLITIRGFGYQWNEVSV